MRALEHRLKSRRPTSQRSEPTSRDQAPSRRRSRGLPRRIRWPLWVFTRLVLPCLILCGIAAGILYVRLLNGPISLRQIADPIAQALAMDLPGIAVTIDDASVLLSEGRGLELRLRNVRLSDMRGAKVAHAPDAAISLSMPALWSGRIAPARIILIEPSLVLQHSAERGMSLTFEDAGKGTGSTATAVSQVDVGAALGALLSQTATSTGTASYIRGIGMRNATLAIDSAGRRSTFKLREADIGMDRRRDGSLLGASLLVDNPRSPWRMSLVANRDIGGNAISLNIKLNDLIPSTLATALPLLEPFSSVDLPIRSNINLKLSGTGEIENGVADVELGQGFIVPGWRGNARMPVGGGRVSLEYDNNTRRLQLITTRIPSGSSWATFAGAAQPGAEPAGSWQFELVATEGQLAAPEFGIAARHLEAFRVRGSLDTGSGVLEVSEATLKAADGEITMTGRVPLGNATSRLLLQGRMSPMSLDALKLLWPSVIAPAAREWSGRQILKGQLTSGSFIVEDIGAGPDRGRAGADGLRIGVTVEGAGVRIEPKPGFAPVEAPRVLVRLEGNALEVAAPDAAFLTSPQRRLPIKTVRMMSTDVAAPAAFGELTFRAQGALPAALDLAEQQAARNGRRFSLPGEAIDGKVDGQVRILVPLGDELTADDTRLEIKGRVADGRARDVIGNWDVTGASLAFELSEQQIDTKGDILVAGVPAKVSIKRIFAATDAEQPPILLTSNLDAAERTKLGLDIGDFVVGTLPVEVLVSPRTQSDPQIQVRANLGNTELHIEPLAWKKPAGRPATLQFEIVRPSKQRTELQGFRIVGEDLSLSGSMVLDGRNRLREFSFPDLALHVVSRLQLSGVLRADNIWDVTARGQTLDARDFFKSLFSVSDTRPRAAAQRTDQSALELKVEIENLIGHHSLSLRGLRMRASNRGGRTIAMQARGVVDSSSGSAGSNVEATIGMVGRERRLSASAENAGQVFRLIGFFPNMQGGRMQLDVNLDGSGPIEKNGRLFVRSFSILGDPVSGAGAGTFDGLGPPGQRRTERARLDFDSMNAPFALGNGQVIVKEADLRGQVLGVVVTGHADFGRQLVDIGGTYVPLQGLNSAIGYIPILGQILAGPRGEGVIGVTFRVAGPMSRPQITVNPASIIPGILREMMKMNNPDPRIRPRETPIVTEPTPGKASQKRPVTPQPPPGATAPAGVAPRHRNGSPAMVDPDGGWSSSTIKPATPRPAQPRAN
jgi:hypothetical protein